MRCWIVAALGFAVICASAIVGFIAHDYINDNILSKAPNSQNSTSASGNAQHLTENEDRPITDINVGFKNETFFASKLNFSKKEIDSNWKALKLLKNSRKTALLKCLFSIKCCVFSL